MARHSSVSKVINCAAGRLQGLKNLVLDAAVADNKSKIERIPCAACAEMLALQHFSFEDLVNKLKNLDSEAETRDVTTESHQAQGEKQSQGEKQASQPVKNTDPFAYAKQQAPDIVLLPPGFGGKAFPYRCNLCRTRRQPGQRV